MENESVQLSKMTLVAMILVLVLAFSFIGWDQLNKKWERDADARVKIANTAINKDRAFLFANKDSTRIRDSLLADRNDYLKSLGEK